MSYDRWTSYILRLCPDPVQERTWLGHLDDVPIVTFCVVNCVSTCQCHLQSFVATFLQWFCMREKKSLISLDHAGTLSVEVGPITELIQSLLTLTSVAMKQLQWQYLLAVCRVVPSGSLATVGQKRCQTPAFYFAKCKVISLSDLCYIYFNGCTIFNNLANTVAL